VIRDGVLEYYWESADRRMQTAQIAILCSKVKEILVEMQRHNRRTSWS
jgi:hypothetical protein